MENIFLPSKAVVVPSNCAPSSRNYTSVNGECLATYIGPMKTAVANGPPRALSARAASQAVTQAITPDMLMDWAEVAYADTFPGHQTTMLGYGFVYRYYPKGNSYIGVKPDGGVYVLLLNTDSQIRYIAPIGDFTCLVTPTASSCVQPVYVVVFTHIEDNTPVGTLGTTISRTNYLLWRDRIIKMAELARRYNMTWVLQPDWKLLEAARLYEDAATMASTGGQNVLRYLRDSLGVVIDPHSHEAGGYNYTDIAYLLDKLGVGGTNVIGGHVWDPADVKFAHWDRFRVPVAGQRYPAATWRGDILTGAGTPNHSNDPIVSGVWRPKAPTSFFEDDPLGNIVNVGDYKKDIAGITTLRSLSGSGRISGSCMLTSTFHVTPAMINSTATLATLERAVLQPLQSLRASGQVEITNFTSLVATWKTRYASNGCLYQE